MAIFKKNIKHINFKAKDKTCSNSTISSDSTIIIITTHATDISITTGTTNTWDPLPQAVMYSGLG